MSTKTTFKRVALVAVAALGLGVLSVAPSSATAVTVTLTPSATTSTIATTETATITIAASAVAGASTDSLTIRAVVTSANVATSGTLGFAATTDSTTTIIRTPVAGPNASITMDSSTVAQGQLIRGSVKLNLVTPSAKGTYTVYVYTTSGGTSGASSTLGVDKEFTWTVTVTAASTSADTSSTVYIGKPSTAAYAADASVTASKASAVTDKPAAQIEITAKNATSSASEDMIVQIAGPGYLALNGASTDSNTARSTRTLVRSGTQTGNASATTYVQVFSDGTSGVATITVTGATSGTVIGTKTLTFSDTKPSTIAVTVKKAYIAAGASTAKVFAVTLKDAASNAITSSAAVVTGTRTDTTTAGKALATSDLACTWDSTDSVYYCTAVGASTIKFGPAEYKITATGTDADATAISAAASTTFADTVATSVTISAAANASIGDKVTYTLTAKEKNGYPIADQSYEGGSANGSTGGIFWNTTTVPDYTSSTVKPFNAGETITTVSGVATKAIYMPVAAGTVDATWTLAGKSTAPVGAIDKSIAATVITVTTAVTNAGVDAATDAANEATDAANAATDAALAAADAADAATAAAEDASAAVATLAASVNTALGNLKKQISALAALVNKLLKKK